MTTPDETPKKNLGWLPPEVEALIPKIQADQEAAEERITRMFDTPAYEDAAQLTPEELQGVEELKAQGVLIPWTVSGTRRLLKEVAEGKTPTPGPGDKALESVLQKREQEEELSQRQKEQAKDRILRGPEAAALSESIEWHPVRDVPLDSMVTTKLLHKEESLKKLLTGKKSILTLKFFEPEDVRAALGTIHGEMPAVFVQLGRDIPGVGHVSSVTVEVLSATPGDGRVTVEMTDMQFALLGLHSGLDRHILNARALKMTISKADASSPQGKLVVTQGPPSTAETLRGESSDALHDEQQSEGRTEAREGMDAELTQMRDDASNVYPTPENAPVEVEEAVKLWNSRDIPTEPASKVSAKPVTPELDSLFATPGSERVLGVRGLNSLMAEMGRLTPRLRSRISLKLEFVDNHDSGYVLVTASINPSRSLWEDLK